MGRKPSTLHRPKAAALAREAERSHLASATRAASAKNTASE